jgi:hypothetical protein
MTTSTTFGTVTRESGYTTVSADGDTLRDWAHRGDNSWPCSALATLDACEATFCEVGDLIELRCTENDEDVDLSSDELNAWTSECLVRAGYPNHPAIRGAVA